METVLTLGVQIASILTGISVFIMIIQLRNERKHQGIDRLLYLYEYLNSVELSKARHIVRTDLCSKEYALWSQSEKGIANMVCASYDQAGMLIAEKLLNKTMAEMILRSSWGESICDQYEALQPYLEDRQTPHKTGKEFFQHFALLYERAKQTHRTSTWVQRHEEDTFMQTSKRSTTDLLCRGAELEFVALREELLKRIELRQNLVAITLTLAAALLGFGVNNTPILLFIPPLFFCLSLLWANNDVRVKQIGKYLQGIESKIPGLEWETHYRRDRLSQTVLAGISLSVLAPSGTFIIVELLAIGVGISRFSYTSLEWTLLILNISFVVMTLLVLAYVGREDRKYRL